MWQRFYCDKKQKQVVRGRGHRAEIIRLASLVFFFFFFCLVGVGIRVSAGRHIAQVTLCTKERWLCSKKRRMSEGQAGLGRER